MSLQCLLTENVMGNLRSNNCLWVGHHVYRNNVVNDIINKICIVFVCFMYLICILYSVFRKYNK